MNKKRLPSALLLFALLLVLCFKAFATDQESKADFFAAPPSNTQAALSSAASVTVNETLITDTAMATQVGNETYIAIEPFVEALYPFSVILADEAGITAYSQAFWMRADLGLVYFTVNDRCIYVPDTVRSIDGILMVPVQALAEAFGCTVTQDAESHTISIAQTGPVTSIDYYNVEDLYWLSCIIHAESGNQPMDGRIAVGTVVLNRVAHADFPNTVKEVILAPGQFSPVSAGTIEDPADPDSIVAAKLCLEGARVAEESLYFNITTMYSWADKSRPFICTIGDHNFYA